MGQRTGTLESVVSASGTLIDPRFWAGRRVLLTGHTGFKGSWLTLWLLSLGAEVHGLSLPADSQAVLFHQLDLLESHQVSRLPGRLLHGEGDLRDPEVVVDAVQRSRPEVVLHLAAQSLVRPSYADPWTTWSTNVIGSLQLLEALRGVDHPCAVVMVTTDKVYLNQEWPWGYRECDKLGGQDPYSASKAAMELLVASWRASFCGPLLHQTPQLSIATARAGNVIGGGDWAADRLVPDAIRALVAGEAIQVRNPASTRPWQHVLEPLAGYLLLAERLHSAQKAEGPNPYADAFNFGPAIEANRSVRELVELVLSAWPGSWLEAGERQAPHEAGLLHLVSDRARTQLGWQPRWDFAITVGRTVDWYRQVEGGGSAVVACLADLEAYAASRSIRQDSLEVS